MKKLALALVCLLTVLALAGCTAVTSDNSFQSQAPGEIITQPQAQPQGNDQPAAEPSASPTSDPNASGYNG